MRRQIHEVPAPAATRRERTNPWWQICGIREFKERISKMTQDEGQELLAEIKGAIAMISVTVQDVAADPERRGRARAALAYSTEKRHALVAHLSEISRPSRKEAHRERSRRAAQAAREALNRGDTTEALNELINWLDEFGS